MITLTQGQIDELRGKTEIVLTGAVDGGLCLLSKFDRDALLDMAETLPALEWAQNIHQHSIGCDNCPFSGGCKPLIKKPCRWFIYYSDEWLKAYRERSNK